LLFTLKAIRISTGFGRNADGSPYMLLLWYRLRPACTSLLKVRTV